MIAKESAFFFILILVFILFPPVMSYTEHTAAKTVAVLCHFLLCACIFSHPKLNHVNLQLPHSFFLKNNLLCFFINLTKILT